MVAGVAISRPWANPERVFCIYFPLPHRTTNVAFRRLSAQTPNAARARLPLYRFAR
jgi:hypothetical protein